MEFLFSKDVREIIAKLRAEGRLNEDVLKNLKGFFWVNGLQGFCFALLPLLLIPAGMKGYVPLILCAVLVSIAVSDFLFRIKKLPNRFIPLYLFGSVAKGEVNRDYRTEGMIGNYSVGWDVWYKFTVKNKIYEASLRKIPIQFWSRRYQSGEEIDVYYDPLNPENNFPDIQNLGAFFNLVKER